MASSVAQPWKDSEFLCQSEVAHLPVEFQTNPLVEVCRHFEIMWSIRWLARKCRVRGILISSCLIAEIAYEVFEEPGVKQICILAFKICLVHLIKQRDSLLIPSQFIQGYCLAMSTAERVRAEPKLACSPLGISSRN